MILDMKKNILYLFSVLLCLSCDDYLDTMPDNRAEIDSEEKINKLWLVLIRKVIILYAPNYLLTMLMITEVTTLILIASWSKFTVGKL